MHCAPCMTAAVPGMLVSCLAGHASKFAAAHWVAVMYELPEHDTYLVSISVSPLTIYRAAALICARITRAVLRFLQQF